MYSTLASEIIKSKNSSKIKLGDAHICIDRSISLCGNMDSSKNHYIWEGEFPDVPFCKACVEKNAFIVIDKLKKQMNIISDSLLQMHNVANRLPQYSSLDDSLSSEMDRLTLIFNNFKDSHFCKK